LGIEIGTKFGEFRLLVKFGACKCTGITWLLIKEIPGRNPNLCEELVRKLTETIGYPYIART
jgi:hypothetical protein